MNVLVTGGAGYIGSFMTKRLLDEGHTVVVVDSLERGSKAVVDQRASFVQGNFLDKQFTESLFKAHSFTSVIHFAGYISMGESMENPALYFENNTYATLNILEAMKNNSVKKIIFSSTAGVYGNPLKIPIPEDHIKDPTNPYGESKRMAERLLSWYHEIFGIDFVGLRYFNASGAALDGSVGEQHDPETHIIPSAIKAVLKNTEFSLFGDTYSTPDGTCIRDYIHILDLVEAHVLALEKINSNSGKLFYNVGAGKGYSNKEVLDMVQKISGKPIQIKVFDKRPGDADQLVADVSRIREELNFSPKFSDLETIVKSAWEWHRNNSKFKVQNSK